MINCAITLSSTKWLLYNPEQYEQYVTSSHIDRLWSCQAGSRNRGGERHADMNRAILVCQVLSYRHFLGSDDDSGDSSVLCDHSRSFRVVDKHPNVNFSWGTRDKRINTVGVFLLLLNVCFYPSYLGTPFDLAQFAKPIRVTSLKLEHYTSSAQGASSDRSSS